MINLCFSLLIPIPFMGGGKLSGIKDAVQGALSNLGVFILLFEIFLIFVFVALLIFVCMAIYKFRITLQLKNLLIFLYRLHTELLLYKYMRDVKEEKRLEIKLSKEESVTFIQDIIKRKFFIKKVGEHEVTRILDGLNLIKTDKISLEVQLLLVNNWIELVKSL